MADSLTPLCCCRSLAFIRRFTVLLNIQCKFYSLTKFVDIAALMQCFCRLHSTAADSRVNSTNICLRRSAYCIIVQPLQHATGRARHVFDLCVRDQSRVRENIFYFIAEFQQKHDFFTFFEMTFQKKT